MLVCLGVMALQQAALQWVVPRYVARAAEQWLGGAVDIGGVAWQFPNKMVLTQLHSNGGWPHAGFHVERMVLRPAWISWRRRTIWLHSVDIEQPWARISRTPQGVLLWPALSLARQPKAAGAAPTLSRSPGAGGWTLVVNTLSLADGTLEFSDDQVLPPFHGLMDHVSFVAGPLTMWPLGQQTNLAVRGQIVGYHGHAAPIYCSGWFHPVARALNASCQLEPIPLAAFEPYYARGATQVRVYQAMLSSTSQWAAQDNVLEGRVQLVIDNLQEGDISVRGSTLVDIRRLAAGGPPILSGEIQVTGPLDAPTRWRFDLVPGNEMVQRLVKPLLDRGREMVQLRLGGQTIKVGIGRASETTMSGIEAASKQVEASLELLSTPLPGDVLNPPVDNTPGSMQPAAMDGENAIPLPAVPFAAPMSPPSSAPPSGTQN